MQKERFIKSGKLRKSAKLQDCFVRIPSICNFNPETVVLAHVGSKGQSLKKSDIHAAFACSACHDELDGRTHNSAFSKNALKLMHYEGVERTQDIWINNGMLIVNPLADV
jgi:hypothetical protein